MLMVQDKKDEIRENGAVYEDPFYCDAPFYRAGMPVEEYKREQIYLNENVDIFIEGSYVPLWKQKLRKSKKRRKGD